MPAYRAFTASMRAREAIAASEIVEARVEGAAAHNFAGHHAAMARRWCWCSAAALFIIANDVSVGRTFIFLPLIFAAFGLVIRAFWTNVYIFCIAEVLVLVWGLVVAIARLIPGAAGPAGPPHRDRLHRRVPRPAGDHHHLPRRLRPAARRPAGGQGLSRRNGSPSWR